MGHSFKEIDQIRYIFKVVREVRYGWTISWLVLITPEKEYTVQPNTHIFVTIGHIDRGAKSVLVCWCM